MAGRKSRQRPGEGAQERTPSKIFGSWFTMILSSLCGIALAFHFHYKVPLPANHHGFNTEGVSDFSEHNAINIISHLSNTIGYSEYCVCVYANDMLSLTHLLGIVGTLEEKQSYDYIEDVITQYKKESQGIIGSPKFDIWVQQGTSSHRFDIMDKSEFWRF